MRSLFASMLETTLVSFAKAARATRCAKRMVRHAYLSGSFLLSSHSFASKGFFPTAKWISGEVILMIFYGVVLGFGTECFAYVATALAHRLALRMDPQARSLSPTAPSCFSRFWTPASSVVSSCPSWVRSQTRRSWWCRVLWALLQRRKSSSTSASARSQAAPSCCSPSPGLWACGSPGRISATASRLVRVYHTSAEHSCLSSFESLLLLFFFFFFALWPDASPLSLQTMCSPWAST